MPATTVCRRTASRLLSATSLHAEHQDGAVRFRTSVLLLVESTCPASGHAGWEPRPAAPEAGGTCSQRTVPFLLKTSCPRHSVGIPTNLDGAFETLEGLVAVARPCGNTQGDGRRLQCRKDGVEERGGWPGHASAFSSAVKCHCALGTSSAFLCLRLLSCKMWIVKLRTEQDEVSSVVQKLGGSSS